MRPDGKVALIRGAADAENTGWSWDAYVASDGSSFITGAVLPVDGGGVAG